MTSTNIVPLENAWPKPDVSFMREGERSGVPLFPLDTLGPFWSEFVCDVGEREIPRDFVATALLGTVAGLIGNSTEAKMPSSSFTQPATLWAVLVGHPGSGKSPALKPFTAMVTEIEQRLGIRRKFDDSTIAGVLKIMRANETGEPGLLLMNHELSGWWSAFKMERQGEQFWLKAWDGDEQYVVDRGNAEPFHIERLNISVLGGTQPGTLGTMLAATGGVEKGFVSRCMMSFPDPVTEQDWSGREADVGTATDFLTRIAALYQGTTRVVPVTDKASSYHAAWFSRLREEQWLDPEEPVGQWLIKQRGTSIRLALILEHLWWCARSSPDPKGFERAQKFAAMASDRNDNPYQREIAARKLKDYCDANDLDCADVIAGRKPSVTPPSRIGLRAMEAAARLIETYFLPHFERGQSFAYAGTTETAAKALCKMLVKGSVTQFNAKDLRDYKFGKVHPSLHAKQAAGANVVYEFLEERNIIARIPAPFGKVGRKRADYEVNPALLKRATTRTTPQTPQTP